MNKVLLGTALLIIIILLQCKVITIDATNNASIVFKYIMKEKGNDNRIFKKQM